VDVDSLSKLSGLLAGFADESDADGITLWQAVGQHLVALVNPLENELPGMRQPIRSGIISQVYLTGQAILDEAPRENPRHDPAIDNMTGRNCIAMMAAPVRLPDAVGGDGVVSVVKTKGGRGSRRFTLEQLAGLSRLAEKISASGRSEP
jgi:hypothetical protein